MPVYIITEKQNLQSQRKGEKVECKNITGAKSCASRRKMFKGTVMTIETEKGRLIAYKSGSGKWQEAD